MIADKKRELRKAENPKYQTKVPKEYRRKREKSKTGMDGIKKNPPGLESKCYSGMFLIEGVGDRRNLHLEPGLVSRRGQVCTVVEPKINGDQ
jgi:hypothetical protein